MLEFTLHRQDLDGPWHEGPAGWSAGNSRIAPLRLRALEEIVARCGRRLLVAVRERCRGAAGPVISGPAGCGTGAPVEVSPAQWEKILAGVTSWPLQYVCLTVEPGSAVDDPPRVTIRSGAWGTAPVFAVASGDGLHGHWDPVLLYPLLDRDTPLEETLAAHFLATFETPYARRTMLRGLHMITERSVARWPTEDGTLAVHYPVDAEPYGEREVRPDADVLDGLWRCLTSSVRRWLPDDAASIAGCELSGGLDSALVTAAVAEVTGTGPRTYGLALAGVPGARQHARRAELVRRFGGADTTVPFAAHRPLAPDGPETFGRGAAGPMTPWEECYAEASEAMLDRAVQDGIQMIFTGLGGDELSHPRRRAGRAGERPTTLAPEQLPAFLTPAARDAALAAPKTIDTAPSSIPRGSAIETTALSSAQYLRRGIWPVHPLCTPELVRLCAWLPTPWRTDRLFERHLLTRRGISPLVAFPPDTDDFEPVLIESLRHTARHRLETLFTTPLLADHGLVDPIRLQASYRAWRSGEPPDDPTPFYAAATLELTLRTLTGHTGEA
ncbi:asparagine synthase-related protein [Actinocorallia longicatena]|uniref:Asparagine synthetase domain-containing protein n=1 Tax=Actinocorallia longicatena TaxID=111803 RepID=A0ABP6QCX6_9ACTN